MTENDRAGLVPQLGFGTWQIQGRACTAAVAEALRVGYRHIDTAALYENETDVGEGIRLSGVPRQDIFLVTKVAPQNLHDGDLQRSAERSVGRLKVSEVDLLLVHWPNRRIPLAETMAALADAVRRGLTRHVGVSNFDAGLLREAIGLCPVPVLADQVEYHPHLDQDELLAECRRRDVAFVSYSPLARQGVLSEPVIVEIAAGHRRTPAQIVLRWHVQQGCVVIPKSANPARIRENAAIFDFVLTGAEMDAISALKHPARRGGR